MDPCIRLDSHWRLVPADREPQINNIMKRVLCLLLCCSYVLGYGQFAGSTMEEEEKVARSLAATITVSDLKNHLTTIASAEFEGRETGTEGQKKAAAYIAKQFEQMGLPTIGEDGTYYQKISFIAESWKNIELNVNGNSLRHMWDYYAYPANNADSPTQEFKEVVFLGYGIDDARYSDYKNADVAGKAILIYAGEPMGKDSLSRVSGERGATEWSKNIYKKLQVAKEKGVAMVFIIDPDFKNNVGQARRTILNRRLKMGWSKNPADNYANNCFISTKVAKEIIGGQYKKVVKARKKINKRKRAKRVKLPTNLTITMEKNVRQLLGENVLGFVEGSDPAKKDEVIVVTAHYDHLGKRGDDIYYGADDNGSGTSSVLEVCQAFVEAKKAGRGPSRSVLFMLVSGEEKGLLGSEYYAQYPVFPLENTVANVNVDMVGRVDEKHAENPNYIYVIGSNRLSTELHEINETANRKFTQLELDYTYNAENDPNRYYYRSDHYNFAEKGVPAIFYFNGTHDDYHLTSDTVDKINFEKMANIAQLVFHTTWELANRADRIKVDVLPKR